MWRMLRHRLGEGWTHIGAKSDHPKLSRQCFSSFFSTLKLVASTTNKIVGDEANTWWNYVLPCVETDDRFIELVHSLCCFSVGENIDFNDNKTALASWPSFSTLAGAKVQSETLRTIFGQVSGSVDREKTSSSSGTFKWFSAGAKETRNSSPFNPCVHNFMPFYDNKLNKFSQMSQYFYEFSSNKLSVWRFSYSVVGEMRQIFGKFLVWSSLESWTI